ncbi:hypothetical protein [Lactococcus lactis]|uniref:Uncharacterized protein n=1 Tax=Lactococcus lactis subsp. lactis TaxID=1360 RepID=A0A0V8E0Q4_LACLL|nr:hypothetical protein [Lactococcus lactis]KSU19421.1 hypothetical protein M20_2040 [Lactococcus lactis subsp. lactis]MCC4121744.1 hypothetical protein [Lactococcus lactis]
MKKKSLIIVAILLVLALIGVFAFLQARKQPIERVSKEYITNQSTQPKVSTSESSSSTFSSKEAKVEVSSETKALVSQFLMTDVTYDLTVKSILARSETLSKIMTKDAYEQMKIQSTTESLVAMTNKWLTTKQVDTSSGDVQLVSQKYQSANVTPSAQEPNRFYVELNYDETPVTTKETQSKTQLLWVSVTDNKVSDVEIITTK